MYLLVAIPAIKHVNDVTADGPIAVVGVAGPGDSLAKIRGKPDRGRNRFHPSSTSGHRFIPRPSGAGNAAKRNAGGGNRPCLKMI